MNSLLASWRVVAVLALTAVVCLAAWLLPTAKPEAVAGRLSYFQFLLALLVSGLLVTVAVVACFPAARRRAVAFRLGALWLGGGVALVIWETTARLLPPRHAMDNPWYLFSSQGVAAGDDLPFERPPHLRWQGLSRGDLAILNGDADPNAVPVTFVTDHQGFRNGEDRSQADLVFLGDSFTEAGNVPEADTFVQLTATALKQTARNLGRAGYTGPSELLVLKKYGLASKPRTVVWQIAESNDLYEAVLFQEWEEDGRPPYLALKAVQQAGQVDPWKQRSPTWRLFQQFSSPRLWPLRGDFRDKDGRVHDVRFLELPSQSHSPVGNPGWPILAKSLRDGANLLRGETIDLVVLNIPTKVRGLGPSLTTAVPIQDMPESMTLATHLGQLCKELNVPFVDATPLLRAAAASGELVYLAYDTHLSVQGHQVVSAALVDVIRKQQRRD